MTDCRCKKTSAIGKKTRDKILCLEIRRWLWLTSYPIRKLYEPRVHISNNDEKKLWDHSAVLHILQINQSYINKCLHISEETPPTMGFC